MLNRYPHIATIKISREVDNGTSIPTLENSTINLKGRYAPNNQGKSLDYSAKFYCESNELDQFEVDGKKLIYSGKEFTIVQLHNYQTHCEIWLD